MITLEPGDVILTGTPANSRPMKPGDVVEVEISGIGRLTNTIEEWDVDLAGPGRADAGLGADAPRRARDPRGRGGADGGRGPRAVIRLHRLDHVCLRVADLDEASARWCAPVRARRALARRAGARCSPATTSRTASSSSRAERPGHDHFAFELAHDCSLDDARAHLEALGVAVARSARARLFVDDPDGRPVQLMPYRAPASEVDRWPQHARPSTHRPPRRRRASSATSTASRATSTPASAFYTDVLGMRLSDWLGEAGVWFHINSDHHVMALVDVGYAHFHHLAFETVDIGKMRDMLDHVARHGRWLVVGADPPRDRRQHRELRADRRGGVPRRALLRHGAAPGRPRAARLPRRSLLVEHLGAAAAALVLPLRPGRGRVRAREPGDARARPSAAARRTADVPSPGYTIPRTPEGRASLVPYPPWHYVGDVPRRRLLGRSREGRLGSAERASTRTPTPAAARSSFADWQSCSEGGDELSTRPARSTRRSSSSSTRLLDGEEVTTCPFIWVDRDFALTRGWLQGFPKKLGSIWITRSFGLGEPADPGSGGRGDASARTCAAYERRVAEATVTLERLSESGPFHNDPPIVNVRHFPRLEAGQPRRPRRARARPRRRRAIASSPTVWEGSATLELFGAPHEEHDLLAPVRIGQGYRFTFGYTVDDLETVKDLRA